MTNKSTDSHGTITGLLNAIAADLALFLENVLPTLFDDWWKSAVISNLTFQQRRWVEQREISSLGGLDLAGLLRILDQNWYQISTTLDLTTEFRHFAKEMQTVRNRWAHATSDGFHYEDIYRDLDTMQRFAVLIGSHESLIQSLRHVKTDILTQQNPNSSQDSTDASAAHIEEDNSFEFKPGQIVFLKSKPEERGAILAVIPGSIENRFNVFLEGRTQIFYASQLQAEEERGENPSILSCEQFHAHLTALQIRCPTMSTLYSLNTARIDFIPYQFRPVLRFIRSDRPRLLIADSVGVGKTIEAGLILRELQARRDIRSVLIICPRPLVTERKWQIEMKRFDERFSQLDGSSLRFCINETDLDGIWPEQHQKAILPYSLFDESLLYGAKNGSKGKQKKGLLELDPPPRFDLVIVDEAHHIRNEETFCHKGVRYFCDHAEAVLFLTATPIQLGNSDLFVLLNTLRPDLIIDRESFEHMAAPNPFINRAVTAMRTGEAAWDAKALQYLDQAASTSWGQAILRHNPNFVRTCSRLLEGNLSHVERIRMISDTENMHTFSGIINRTRRRDIGSFTIRKPETIVVPFTPEQQQLHNELLRIQADILSRLHGQTSVKFMMTTIRRQAASCLFGLAPLLEGILNRHIDELFFEEIEDEATLPEEREITSMHVQVQELIKMAKSLGPYDPKLEALHHIIRDKQMLPNNKVMLFSSFRHTLSYLNNKLISAGHRVGMVHGGTPDEERNELRARFQNSRENPDCIDILLFSEVGCEGLDYQFCDCIVNYDLPWNPMRVEQRIGRIDRNGQRSESIAIVNLITPGTVDADIYERCLLRIGVFNSALGGSEEILGEITKEIRSIAESYDLSENERKYKLQQLADNKVRLIQEEEELEQRQVELFGIHVPESRMNKEIEDAASFWLSAASIQRLVALYLRRLCGREQEFFLGEKKLKTLRLSQEGRNSLLQDFQALPRQNNSVYREWENWLRGGNPHMLITFECDCAAAHKEAAFITPLHPLVKQAAISLDCGQYILTNLSLKNHDIPTGRHDFAIYQWRFQGVREDLTFQMVASSEALSKKLANLLEAAVDCTENTPAEISATVREKLDAEHYNIWNDAREKHRQHTRELVEFRRESLSTSHRARMALLMEQLAEASNEKIKKMRCSQIATAEADYARRLQDLDIAAERADILAETVAYGVINVIGGESIGG